MPKSYLYIPTKDKRTIIIGDIHGCYTELLELLTKINFSPEDILISVGDIVDRGPDSEKVVDFFKSTPNAYVVFGNHERKICKIIEGIGTLRGVRFTPYQK